MQLIIGSQVKLIDGAIEKIFPYGEVLQLLSKLEGLQIKEVNFELYRKTIFECINILQELN